MTKLQVLSGLSLLLTSTLCSVSSATLFNYGVDGADPHAGLRGPGYEQDRGGASDSLIKQDPDEEGEPEPIEDKTSHGEINSNEAEQDGTTRPSKREPGNRIIGGYEAKPNKHSYAASLHDNAGHFCGGSLITRNAILTAAHCQGGQYKVAVGRHDLRSNEGQVLRMKEEVPHPRYDEYTTDYDYMVVFLNGEARLNDEVGLVTLNDDPSVPEVGESCTPMGWGDTDRRDDVSKLSDVLMKVQVRVISKAECDASSGTIGGYEDNYNDQITNNMLCAEAPRKDSCQGDSGGPLVTTYGEKQVGVVSWGIGCASDHFPGVYARVSRVYPWIEREVCRENKKYATEAGFQC